MKISAQVENTAGSHRVTVKTGDHIQTLDIPPKANGLGSGINGGELLFLALATCYCNDLYREAAKRQITVQRVEVEVEGEFGGEGEPARRITYSARVAASASDAEIDDLLRHTDRVAEIHNTLRTATEVTLKRVEILQA